MSVRHGRFSPEEAEAVSGTPVVDPNGARIGTADLVFRDDHTGQANWLAVTLGPLGLATVFIPAQRAVLREGVVTVAESRDVVRKAPRPRASDHLAPHDEERLLEYYAKASG